MTVYVFQSMIFPYLKMSGLVPLLLPIVSTGVAVYQGRVAGGVSGLFAGILCDVSFNKPVGVFTVVLTMAGIAVGALTDTVLTRRFGSFIICSAAVLTLVAFIQLFPLLFFEGVPPYPLFITALRQTVYSLAFTFPLWFFVRSLGLRAGMII
jgi:rod shape-determining protein MreD